MPLPHALLQRVELFAVCIKVINDIKEASKGLKDLEAIEGKLQTVCSKVTDVKDKKLVRANALVVMESDRLSLASLFLSVQSLWF